MEWKELFAKFKDRQDHFEAEAGPEKFSIESNAPQAIQPVLSNPVEKPQNEDMVLADGKYYRKVRLKIVAAWDEETADKIASLESEVNNLRTNNEKLIQDNERMTAQHTLMQQLNSNLYTLRIADIDKSTDRIAQLESKATTRQQRIRDLEEQIREARMLIHDARMAIEQLEQENDALRKKQDIQSHIENASTGGDLHWVE